jgi:hypothetical protein
MANRLPGIKTLAALGLVLFAILGCYPAPAVPSATGTLAPATEIVQATGDAESAAVATPDESATRAAESAGQTEQAQVEAAATAAGQAAREAALAAMAAWPNRVRDGFEDNGLDWPVGLTSDHSLAVTSSISARRYQWTVDVSRGNSYFNLIPAGSPVFSDFYAGVTVQFTQGGEESRAAYGLAFRHVEDDYGFFGITGTGHFRILEVHHTGIYQLWTGAAPGIESSPGGPVRVEVVGLGPDFVFLINHQVAGQMKADIAAGQIGLGVDAVSVSPHTVLEFSDFQINAPK